MRSDSEKSGISFIIDNLWKFFFRMNTIYFFCAVALLFFVLSLFNRYVYIDDAWFGEQAFWFSKFGFPKTTTIKDFFGWDERLYVYHKLNIIIAASIVKIFGWSVYYLKFFTLLVYSLFFFVYYKFFRYHSDKYSQLHFFVASFYIFIIPLMLSLAFTYRPEILIMCLGFLSYFLLEKYFATREMRYVSLSAFFAGLAFLTHLNGMIFCIAGFFVLILKRDWKALICFSGIAFLVSAFYFYDLWQPGHFEMFLYQMHSWPDDISTNYNANGITSSFYRIISKLLSEHKRFFWSERIQITSIIFLLSLLINFRSLLRDNRRLIIYMAVLLLSLNLFGSQIAERYLIYLFPYFGIIVSMTVIILTTEKMYTVKTLFLLLFLMQFFFFGKMLVEIIHKNSNFVKSNHELLEKIPGKNDLILVPYEFIFNELENRNLATYKGFEYYQVIHGPFTLKSFFERAKKLNIKYVVLSKEVLSMEDTTFPFFTELQVKNDVFYSIFYQEKNSVILKVK